MTHRYEGQIFTTDREVELAREVQIAETSFSAAIEEIKELKEAATVYNDNIKAKNEVIAALSKERDSFRWELQNKDKQYKEFDEEKQQLQRIINNLEQRNAQLRGYIDRVREAERPYKDPDPLVQVPASQSNLGRSTFGGVAYQDSNNGLPDWWAV